MLTKGGNHCRSGYQELPESRMHVATDEDLLVHGTAPRGWKIPASQGTFQKTVPELAKRFRALKKEFIVKQRSKAAKWLAENKAATEAYVANRLQEARSVTSLGVPKRVEAQTDEPVPLGPPGASSAADADGSSGLPPGVLPLSLSDRKVTVKPAGNSQILRAFVHVLPYIQPPPLYTTWSYLKRNELARDHGRRMFLVDSSGETVPADDGEVDERLPWEDVDGAAVDWSMAQLAEEHGWEDPEVLEALMDVLRPRPQPEAIAQRLAYLQQHKLDDEDRQQMEVDEVLDAFCGSFCRRCRIFGCRTHSGGHVKPHHRPAPLPPDLTSHPCGNNCWKTARTAATAAATATAPTGSGSSGAPEDKLRSGAVVSGSAQKTWKPTGPNGSPGGGSLPGAPLPLEGGTDAMDVDGCYDERAAGGNGNGSETSKQRQNQPQQPSMVACGPGSEGGEQEMSEAAGEPSLGGCNGQPPWTPYELSLVRKGIQVFGAGCPCGIATFLYGSRTCAEVKAAMDVMARPQRAAPHDHHHHHHQPQVASAAGAGAGAGPWTFDAPFTAVAAAAAVDSNAAVGHGSLAGVGDTPSVAGDAAADSGFLEGLMRVPARRKGSRTKKTSVPSKSARSLVVSARAQHGNNDWHEYQPCTCMGKCKADCPCVRARNFCEKFCACSPSCGERFRGCTCRSGCRTNHCPCWAAGRECDPDLCGGCAPTLEARAELGRDCQNMRLRMRQHARLVLGTSDIPGAGWGLFAAQYVAKNGFLGEYTGDLITQDEANRRGSIYDFMNNSYLFNLNNEWVVDAKFRGNKLRCANHSEEPVAKAKVLLVDGESRIAILADKNLAPGMEITYDYRYSDDTAPHWVKKKQR